MEVWREWWRLVHDGTWKYRVVVLCETNVVAVPCIILLPCISARVSQLMYGGVDQDLAVLVDALQNHLTL